MVWHLVLFVSGFSCQVTPPCYYLVSSLLFGRQIRKQDSSALFPHLCFLLHVDHLLLVIQRAVLHDIAFSGQGNIEIRICVRSGSLVSLLHQCANGNLPLLCESPYFGRLYLCVKVNLRAIIIYELRLDLQNRFSWSFRSPLANELICLMPSVSLQSVYPVALCGNESMPGEVSPLLGSVASAKSAALCGTIMLASALCGSSVMTDYASVSPVSTSRTTVLRKKLCDKHSGILSGDTSNITYGLPLFHTITLLIITYSLSEPFRSFRQMQHHRVPKNCAAMNRALPSSCCPFPQIPYYIFPCCCRGNICPVRSCP